MRGVQQFHRVEPTVGMGMGRSGGGSDMDKGGRKPDAGFSRVLDVDCSKGTPEDRRKGAESSGCKLSSADGVSSR